MKLIIPKIYISTVFLITLWAGALLWYLYHPGGKTKIIFLKKKYDELQETIQTLQVNIREKKYAYERFMQSDSIKLLEVRSRLDMYSPNEICYLHKH